MDKPLALSHTAPAFYATLPYSQPVRVRELWQHADIVMPVPARERFRKWRVQWLAVRAFGRAPKIADPDQRICAGRTLLVEQNRRLLDIKSLRFQGQNEVDSHPWNIRTHHLVAFRFCDMHVLILRRGLPGAF